MQPRACCKSVCSKSTTEEAHWYVSFSVALLLVHLPILFDLLPLPPVHFFRSCTFRSALFPPLSHSETKTASRTTAAVSLLPFLFFVLTHHVFLFAPTWLTEGLFYALSLSLSLPPCHFKLSCESTISCIWTHTSHQAPTFPGPFFLYSHSPPLCPSPLFYKHDHERHTRNQYDICNVSQSVFSSRVFRSTWRDSCRCIGKNLNQCRNGTNKGKRNLHTDRMS
mmetsp:Transcript_38177/g.74991  ORF Transcript_38177/g.74991 Transcript_38177/m.74991 type:complete len:223 (+) Transcript_38177:356-1024(+)